MVWAWGANDRGQLGDGTPAGRLSAVQVHGAMGMGFLSGIKAIAAGTDHSLALKDDGTVWAWGRNDDGQLGNGTMGPDQLNPVQVQNSGCCGPLTGVAGIAAGGFHSTAVMSDGSMRTWGRGLNGQLGNGSTSSSATPVQVSNLTGVSAAAGGDTFTLALKSDGTVWAWLDNQYGQLGDASTMGHNYPVQVKGPGSPPVPPFLSGMKAIAAGGSHSMATDGSGWTWGKNDAGQLGNGNTMSPQLTPVQVSGLTGIGAGGVVSRSTVYSYDRLSRLTNVDAPGASEDTAYTYDPVGNRLSKTRGTTTSYSYDRADRITMAGATSYTVDANGNTIYRGPDSFTYDRANRLKGSMVGGPTVNYSYNGDGVRISKSLPGTTINYVNDVNRSLPVVLDDGTRKYVWGLGLAYEVEGSNAFTYHTDGLGSVRAISDSTGTTAQTYRTDEFGLPMDTQGASAQPFRYTGEQRDAETGFMYLRARSYDPAVGRFMSWDPVDGLASMPLSLNPYTYVQNNPATLVDPSGLTPELPPMAGIKGDQDDERWSPITVICKALGRFLGDCLGGGTGPGGRGSQNPASPPPPPPHVTFSPAQGHSGHGARHLPTGLSQPVVEFAIRADILARGAGPLGHTQFQTITVNGVNIAYRAHTLPGGRVNVGTYYEVP